LIIFITNFRGEKVRVRRKMKKFEELVSYDFSLHLLSQQKWRGIGEFYVDALKSRGLISASKIVSSVDVPSSNRSAGDGCARLAKHTAGASSSEAVGGKEVGTAYPGS
jgi:molybdopterin biosynthesis enzyme